MENTKSKYKKSAIFSVALALAIFTSSCGRYSEDVTVVMNEKKVEEEIDPVVEEKEEISWAVYDEEIEMYKVTLDDFLTNRLNLSKETLENQDIINLVEMIRAEAGEEFYMKDLKEYSLYNPDGMRVYIRSYSGSSLQVIFYDDEFPYEEKFPMEYEVAVNNRGVTISMSKSSEEGVYAFSKYYARFEGGKEISRTFCFREDKDNYLAIRISKGSAFEKSTLSFESEIADATIKISDEEYEALHEIMLSYVDSDDFYKFLSDNLDLLNKYLDLIKEKNEEYYDYLCDYINRSIEKGEVLRYE